MRKGKKAMVLRLSDELHHSLKKEAVERKVTMNAFLIEIIERALKKDSNE